MEFGFFWKNFKIWPFGKASAFYRQKTIINQVFKINQEDCIKKISHKSLIKMVTEVLYPSAIFAII